MAEAVGTGEIHTCTYMYSESMCPCASSMGWREDRYWTPSVPAWGALLRRETLSSSRFRSFQQVQETGTRTQVSLREGRPGHGLATWAGPLPADASSAVGGTDRVRSGQAHLVRAASAKRCGACEHLAGAARPGTVWELTK